MHTSIKSPNDLTKGVLTPATITALRLRLFDVFFKESHNMSAWKMKFTRVPQNQELDILMMVFYIVYEDVNVGVIQEVYFDFCVASFASYLREMIGEKQE